MEDFDIDGQQMDHYILNIFGRVILLEERKTGRMSGMRIFCRMDVSIYRHLGTGKHQFFINEITRTHGAALFSYWETKQRLDGFFFTHLSKTLHQVVSQKIFQKPPTPF
jgi:hypothetical protein